MSSCTEKVSWIFMEFDGDSIFEEVAPSGHKRIWDTENSLFQDLRELRFGDEEVFTSGYNSAISTIINSYAKYHMADVKKGILPKGTTNSPKRTIERTTASRKPAAKSATE